MHRSFDDAVRTALIDLCFERGYHNLSVPELCDRAGIGVEEFEAAYTSMEDCFCAVYGVERERIMGAIARACEGFEGWRDRLRAAAYETFRILTEDERVTHFVVVEVRGAGERPLLMIGEAIETLVDLLDEGRGEIGSGRISRATAESVAGGIFSQISIAVSRGEEVREEVVPQMMYSVVLPYFGHEAALEELSIPPPKRAGPA